MEKITKVEIIEWYKHFHRFPELAHLEVETSAFIREKLKTWGYQVSSCGESTGVLAVLSKGDGPVVALRADMDALPIVERTEHGFASENPGLMHACGHDAHMAIVLGVAKTLATSDFRGTVKFLFQPAEESPPGGAIGMIEAGALENPRVHRIFGLHVNPSLSTGTVGVKSGVLMASPDDFLIKIKGRGGHGAKPHLAVDPITVAAQVILALQNIISRRVDPLEPTVLSFGSIHGGEVYNVIPEEVVIKGTIRTLEAQVAKEIKALIEETLAGVTHAYGATYAFNYIKGYPPLINNSEVTNRAQVLLSELLGKDKVVALNRPSMGGEDFAHYLNQIPGAFLFLGIKPETSESHPWHHPCFEVDQEALLVGHNVLLALTLDVFSQKSTG